MIGLDVIHQQTEFYYYLVGSFFSILALIDIPMADLAPNFIHTVLIRFKSAVLYPSL